MTQRPGSHMVPAPPAPDATRGPGRGECRLRRSAIQSSASAPVERPGGRRGTAVQGHARRPWRKALAALPVVALVAGGMAAGVGGGAAVAAPAATVPTDSSNDYYINYVAPQVEDSAGSEAKVGP